MSNEDNMKRPKFPIIKDWPTKGVNFIDIMPIFSNDKLSYELLWNLNIIADKLIEVKNRNRRENVYVLAIDGRGLIVGTMMSMSNGLPMLTFRDVKKIPQPSAVVSFNNEYSKKRSFSVDEPSLPKGDFSVIIVDDIVATGNTLDAAKRWVKKMGQGSGRSVRVLGSVSLIHLTNLGYKDKELKAIWKMKE